jgi:pimeloyl-ACP methyl ester carboxylesterase
MNPLEQAEWQPQYFDVNGGRLAYYTSGRGEEPVVWLHGLPLDSRSWSAQRAYFSPLACNVFVDLRGYGASSKLPPKRAELIPHQRFPRTEGIDLTLAFLCGKRADVTRLLHRSQDLGSPQQ